jgi:hypothetical protein
MGGLYANIFNLFVYLFKRAGIKAEDEFVLTARKMVQ